MIMLLSNSSLLILILFGPYTLQPKAWELNQLCQQTCSGFDCVRRKPTQIELCDELKKNRLKCCSQYASRNTTTTSKPCQEDVKSQFKEKKRKKKQEGWFLNDACQTACYVFSCLFGKKPTEEELCQVLNIRYNDCCSEKYFTTTTTQKSGRFFTELLLSDPESSSPSQEHSNKEIPSTATSEENEEMDESTTDVMVVDDDAAVDAVVGDDVGIVATKRTRRTKRPRKLDPNRRSKKPKYIKLPDK